MTEDSTPDGLPKGRLILALPCYNEAENLPPLLEEAQRVFNDAGIVWECVAVDDGSTDNTRDVMNKLAGRMPLTPIFHRENRGLGGAISTVINAALDKATEPDDIVVTMDADNTHSPTYALAMTSRIWNEHFDVVIASRFCAGSSEVGVPLGRLILSRGARMLFKIFLRLPQVNDYTCGYRAFRAGTLRQVRDKYADKLITRRGFACTDELLVKTSTVTRRICEVPFTLRYDLKHGASKLPLFRTILETLQLMIFKR